MTPEERSDPQDAHHRAVAKAAGAIVVLHLPADRVPFRLAHASRDAAVGDDLDGVIRHEHVDQHTIVVLGIPDAELPEQLQGARARREIAPQLGHIEGGLDDEADLPSVPRLAIADGLLDRVAHGLRKVPACAPAGGREVTHETQDAHRLLPAPRGAAPPESAASTAETAPA